MAIGDNISQIKKAQSVVQDAKAKADALKNKAQDAVQKAKEISDKAKKIKQLAEQQKEKAEQLKKSLSDKANFLKEQASSVSAIDAKIVIISVVLPILMKFINAEKVASAIINKIINDTKKKLKDKGRVEIRNGAITFIPKNPGNYEQFKKDFDRKVNNLKKVIKILKDAINVLTKTLKIVRTAILAFKVYAKILQIRLSVLAVKSAGELASPIPTKPFTVEYNIAKLNYDNIIKPLEDKIDKYALIATYVLSILKIYQKLVNNIKLKLDTLSLTIVNTSQTPLSSLANSLTDIISSSSPSEVEYTDGNKEYIIKVETTLSGALQAVAFDKFSMMRITQTAPSKIRGADELIEELKQILG